MRGRPTPTQAELRREHGGRGPVQEPRDGEGRMSGALGRLVGDDVSVLCVDGEERRVVDLDHAASTSALPGVVERVIEFLPRYSSVHRGEGAKSRASTAAYEAARHAALAFAGRQGRDDVAIICRNTTEAINHLAYRLRLRPDDVVGATVVEHHANLLPWGRVARRRYIECGRDGMFELGTWPRRSTSVPGPASSPSPAPPTSPAGNRRWMPSSGWLTSGACRSWSMPRSSLPTDRSRRMRTSSRGAGTRCMRPSAPGS